MRDLSRDDFEILDRGVRRRIVDFRASDEAPVSLALLFDVSGSMHVGSKLTAARHAADHVLSAMEPRRRDEAALFSFDTGIRELQPFTQDPTELHRALDRLEPFGATSIYDAIAETARRVTARATKRRAVIVFSDGLDTRSRLTAGQASGVASSIDVPIYVVIVKALLENGDRALTIGSEGTDEGGRLAELAQWTGGDFFLVSAPAHASVAARRIVAELRYQYLLAFEPASTGGWHELEIRTKDREHRVRARGGYMANRPS